QLVPFQLIDPSADTHALVNQALTTGPGIQELEELLAQIQENVEKAQGPGKYMPVIGLRMYEGGFGAGPGDQLTWDNRWDLGLQARWNLTEFATLKARRHVTAARIQQVQINYDDLRGKLAAQVTASHETVRSQVDQFPSAREQIRHGREAFRIIWSRFQKTQEKSAGEVLNAIRGLAGAQM